MGYLSVMTSHSRPDINGPTTAAKETAAKPEGMPERSDAPGDVEERLDTDPRQEPSLTEQPGHDVDKSLQEDT
jgi:hypothetical protein